MVYFQKGIIAQASPGAPGWSSPGSKAAETVPWGGAEGLCSLLPSPWHPRAPATPWVQHGTYPQAAQLPAQGRCCRNNRARARGSRRDGGGGSLSCCLRACAEDKAGDKAS